VMERSQYPAIRGRVSFTEEHGFGGVAVLAVSRAAIFDCNNVSCAVRGSIGAAVNETLTAIDTALYEPVGDAVAATGIGVSIGTRFAPSETVVVRDVERPGASAAVGGVVALTEETTMGEDVGAFGAAGASACRSASAAGGSDEVAESATMRDGMNAAQTSMGSEARSPSDILLKSP
jgi:hypothetical protein